MPLPSSVTVTVPATGSVERAMRRAPESSAFATISVTIVSFQGTGVSVAEVREEVRQVYARFTHVA